MRALCQAGVASAPKVGASVASRAAKAVATAAAARKGALGVVPRGTASVERVAKNAETARALGFR